MKYHNIIISMFILKVALGIKRQYNIIIEIKHNC